MGAMQGDRQSHFFEWLSKSVSSAKLSELYHAFTDLEDALSSGRYLRGPSQSLVQMTDANAVDKLCDALRANKQFMLSYKSGYKLSLLRQYARYCRENQTALADGPQPQAAASGGVPVGRLREESISHTDNRSTNDGVLASKADKAGAPVRELEDPQRHSACPEMKQQRWTGAPSPKAVEAAETVDPAVVKSNQRSFLEWLRHEEPDIVDVYSLYGTARKVHKALLSEGMGLGLLGVQGIDNIRACVKAAKRKEAFIRGDMDENCLWTKALDRYLRYAEAKDAYIKALTAKDVPTGSPVAMPSGGAAPKAPAGTAQQSLPGATDHLTSEAGLRRWLEQNKPNGQAELVFEAIRSAGQFAQGNHMHGARLWGVTAPEMSLAVKRLAVSKAFIKSDAGRYQAFKRAVPVLLEYAKSLDGAEGRASSAKLETAAKAAPASLQRGAEAKECAVLEPALSNLLRGEQFAILRQALLEKGLCTLADVKQLNLWVFMNQNGLYSIGQRQAIYSTVRYVLASEDASGSSACWKIVTQSREYAGASPAEALLEYCRAIALKYPLKFRSLIGRPMNGTNLIPLMRSRLHTQDPCMDNPKVYIDSTSSTSAIWSYAQWICAMCRDDDRLNKIALFPPGRGGNAQSAAATAAAPQKREMPVKPSAKEAAAPTALEVPARASVSTPLQEQVEKLVLAADLEGIPLERLYAQVSTTMAALKQIRDTSCKLVDMGDRLVHVDAFVDWEEAAGKLAGIVEKLLTKNGGYVSSTQLYEYAKAGMQMFLNDNGVDDERSVYCIARHLFDKEGWHGIHYAFISGNHISWDGKAALHKTLDVVNKFAREHNGFFRYDDLAAYLEQLGIRTGNLRGQMRLGNAPYFFYYSVGELLSAESMEIGEAWLDQAEKALNRLFADVGDHIVLRSINPIWYEQLPALPGHRPWTPLLLQYMLQFYGKRLAAKTIGAELTQRYDILHAMLVSWDSEVQTFADAVIAYLVDSGISTRQFEAAALRESLVRGGLIGGNELVSNMPKAIGSDPRFAWDASGENVTIRVW